MSARPTLVFRWARCISINTLGAATGAALVPFVLLPLWTLPQVVWVAVAGNIAVVVCAVLAAQLLPRTTAATTTTGAPA